MDFSTTVVGSGPYGLSVAAHLRARRAPFQLLGTPLESWRSFMPEGMILKSEPFASNLWDPDRRYTLQRFFRDKGLAFQAVGRPLSLSRFLEYADWFRERVPLDSHDVKVARVRRTASGFELRLVDGRSFTTRSLVLATGHMAFRMIPPELTALPEPLVLHSSRIGDVRSYARKDVLIIGAGQSALETAALLHEAGARVRVLVRRHRLEWNAPSKPRPFWERALSPDAGVASGWSSMAVSELPRVFRWYFPAEKRHRFVAGSYGPSGSWWLRERVEDRFEILLGAQIRSAATRGAKVQVRIDAQPDELHADHLIAATGYRVNIDRLDYLDESLRHSIAREGDGIPALDSRFGTSVPGLFMVGIATSPVFGPIMRFMYGAKHAAPVLARRLSVTQRSSRLPP